MRRPSHYATARLSASALLRRFEDHDEPVTAEPDVEPPRRLLRLAARAEFKGRPPEPVVAWLAERGVEL